MILEKGVVLNTISFLLHSSSFNTIKAEIPSSALIPSLYLVTLCLVLYFYRYTNVAGRKCYNVVQRLGRPETIPSVFI